MQTLLMSGSDIDVAQVAPRNHLALGVGHINVTVTNLVKLAPLTSLAKYLIR